MRGNLFRIHLRDIQQSRDLDLRLQQISQLGFPIILARSDLVMTVITLLIAAEMFNGRRIQGSAKRAIYLSASRSYIFNRLVAARIRDNCLQEPMLGDCLMFNNSDSCLVVDKMCVINQLAQRIEFGELVTTAPLWGAVSAKRKMMPWRGSLLF